MRKSIALVLAAGALAATAGQAQAGPSPDEQRIAALERQVASLTSQVRAASPEVQSQTGRRIAALERRVSTLERRATTLQRQLTQSRNIAAAGIFYAQCLTAVTADALTGTWSVVDQIAQGLQGRTYFGQQAAVNDYRACSSNRITRQQGVTPSVSPFSALSALIG